MLRKGCGKMAMDNSCTRITDEESEHPPLTSCSQMALHSRTEKRTTHLLRNRTILFALDSYSLINRPPGRRSLFHKTGQKGLFFSLTRPIRRVHVSSVSATIRFSVSSVTRVSPIISSKTARTHFANP